MDGALSSWGEMVTATKLDPAAIVAGISDPEIPFLSITDLGIVRSVEENGHVVTVTISPTYSGCPAMEAIRADIEQALADEGFDPVVRTVFFPAWTTDAITERGRRLLGENGIAPPGPAIEVLCPRCVGAAREVSQFGSTACKALMVCRSCGEPFDHFKQLR